jgi:hypothetical protein
MCLIQSERLSAETGCWLFVGGQHPHSNKAFAHYSSERIRRDAPQEVTEVASKFGVLCTALVASRRHDTMIMAEKLAAADAQKEIAIAQRAAAEAELEEQKAMNSEKNSQLLYYRTLLGLRPALQADGFT